MSIKDNLIHKLGGDYCTQRMSGTLFNYKGAVHEFVETTGNGVYCTRYEGTPEEVKTSNPVLPFDAFENWKALSWPKLGYRQSANGQVLMLVGRRGSVQRGLHRDALTTNVHFVTQCMSNFYGLNYHYFRQGAPLYMLTMKPVFTPLSEGLTQVMNGNIPAFAVSEDFAVAPHPQVDFLEVLFRGRRIGTISEAGEIKITAEGILPSWSKTINP